MGDSFSTTLIANLPEATAADDTDIMMLENSTETQKIKWSTIIKLIKEKLGIGDTSLSDIGNGTVKGAISSLNSNKIGYNFIALSDSSYPFSENEQTLGFDAIKSCKVLFVKVGLIGSGEISLANGYTEATVVLCNYSGRTICTEGVRIYASQNWNFYGAVLADFSAGTLKIRCKGTTGWTANQFTVKRVYGLM